MEALDGPQGSRHAQLAHQGQQEVEQGMAKLTGGPGATSAASGQGTGARSANYSNDSSGVSVNAASSSEYGANQRANEGNTLGPSSALTAGFGNAGPEVAVAEAPAGNQYTAGGLGPTDSSGAMGQQGSTDRDFGYAQGHTRRDPTVTGQQGSSPGPAPDRYALSGEPTRLG